MNIREKLNYVEYPASDLNTTKIFFSEVFGWKFTDYGPEYTAFDNQGLEGGFYQSQLVSRPRNGAGLLIFYSSDITSTQRKIEEHGGIITEPIFDFPGGCRFHFTEPSGNEFAVWSESR